MGRCRRWSSGWSSFGIVVAVRPCGVVCGAKLGKQQPAVAVTFADRAAKLGAADLAAGGGGLRVHLPGLLADSHLPRSADPAAGGWFHIGAVAAVALPAIKTTCRSAV